MKTSKGMIIAGTHSGCGKTTVTLGILAALKKKGLNVQAFKTGPDFIDAGLHKLITGRTSRNLDLWMCGGDYVKECFRKHSADADIAVVEGVMGLYDGKYSTSALASALDLPVILVVDAYGMAESAGAVVKGFVEYSGEAGKRGSARENFPASALPHFRTRFAGVIFNRVASENHYNRLKESVRDVPVLGYLPRDLDFEIPHRHLGLKTAEEEPIPAEGINSLADAVMKYFDLEMIAQKQGSGKTGKIVRAKARKKKTFELSSFRASALKIAVAYDKAFCFYYGDNLDLLRDAGAEIIPFSPLADKSIPDGTDVLYIGGGYPELYVKELSENRTMLEAIRDFSDSGMPVYAECGGFMYLTSGIWMMEDGEWKMCEMAGIFPFETQMKDRLSKLGYREIHLNEDCILGEKGSVIRGHEFHYSEVINSASALIYSLKDSYGKNLPDEGYRVHNTLGSYVHVHFGSNKDIVRNFIDFSTNSKLMKT
jgi:cobyrinic acid a,c-diamide synthase